MNAIELAKKCGVIPADADETDTIFEVLVRAEELQAFYEAAKQQGYQQGYDKGYSFGEIKSCELSFNAGRNAGRDEAMLAMSKLEPSAYQYDCYGFKGDARCRSWLRGELTDTLPESNSEWVVENVIALIPQPPQTKEGDSK